MSGPPVAKSHACECSCEFRAWRVERLGERDGGLNNDLRTMKTALKYLTLVTLLIALTASAQVPELMNYQGRVIAGGTNFNGAGQFKFALVNATGAATFWSNDGTSVAGSQPAAAVNLNVVNGLYSVLLGDATVPSMTAIPVTVFTNIDVRLRIWFNGGSGWELLSPDQRIATVGYAMMAGNIPDGIITSNKLANGAVTAGKIAAGAITSDKLAANAVSSSNLADSIVLGATNVNGRLDVYRTAAGTPALSLIGSSSQFSTYGSDGLEQIRLWGPTWGEVLLFDKTNNTQTVRLSAGDEGGFILNPFSPGPGGSLLLTSRDGTNQVLVAAGTSGGTMTLYQRDGGTGVFLDGDDNGAGSISVRSTNGSTRVFIDGEDSGGGSIGIRSTNGVNRVYLDGVGLYGGGEAVLYNDNNSATVQLVGNVGSDLGGRLRLWEADGTLSTELIGEDGVGQGARFRLNAGDGTERIELDANDGDSAAAIRLRDSTGAITITLDAESAGQGRITTQILQITGGSDLSENFDIKPVHIELKPGMVVSIDPENPGQLVTSSSAYDKTVAGVMSGAGGVKPGMLMGQHGTAADGKHPVALTGRVYCYVDADQGAIKPGDLITTSNTPGHGMKVQDSAQAQGAIIGKAMTPLASGKGLVLVLVSLQ